MAEEEAADMVGEEEEEEVVIKEVCDQDISLMAVQLRVVVHQLLVMVLVV
jgi:hypothetical protein